MIGSRTAERAEAAAEALAEVGVVSGAANADAASIGDVVLVVVPWDGHKELLESLASPLACKIVVECVNPLGFDKQGAYALAVEEGSATQQAAAILTESRVVGAFHNVSAVLLEDSEVASIETDVLVLGDDREATDLVQALADVVPGMRGIYATVILSTPQGMWSTMRNGTAPEDVQPSSLRGDVGAHSPIGAGRSRPLIAARRAGEALQDASRREHHVRSHEWQGRRGGGAE